MDRTLLQRCRDRIAEQSSEPSNMHSREQSIITWFATYASLSKLLGVYGCDFHKSKLSPCTILDESPFGAATHGSTEICSFWIRFSHRRRPTIVFVSGKMSAPISLWPTCWTRDVLCYFSFESLVEDCCPEAISRAVEEFLALAEERMFLTQLHWHAAPLQAEKHYEARGPSPLDTHFGEQQRTDMFEFVVTRTTVQKRLSDLICESDTLHLQRAFH